MQVLTAIPSPDTPRRPWRRLALTGAALGALATLCACGSSKVDINRSYRMVDEHGRTAGEVVFFPVGGGAVYDADHTLIGSITPPNAPPGSPQQTPPPR